MKNLDDFIIDKLEITPSISLLNEINDINIEKHIRATDCTFILDELKNCDLLKITSIADAFGYIFTKLTFDKRVKKYFVYFNKSPNKFVVNDILKLFTNKLYLHPIEIKDNIANIDGDEIELFANKENKDMLELDLDMMENGFGIEQPLIYYNAESMKLATRDKLTIL